VNLYIILDLILPIHAFNVRIYVYQSD